MNHSSESEKLDLLKNADLRKVLMFQFDTKISLWYSCKKYKY